MKRSGISISSSKGFTLIEVLVSAVILFAVVSLSASIYSTSLISSQKIKDHLKIQQIIPIVLPQVKESLLATYHENRLLAQMDGQFILGGVNIDYHAIREDQSTKSKSTNNDNVASSLVEIWNVQLSVRYENAVNDFNYKELVW